MGRPTTRFAHLLPLIEGAFRVPDGWRPSAETCEALQRAAALLRRDMEAVSTTQPVRAAASILGVHLRSLQEWGMPSRPDGHRHRAKASYTGTDEVAAKGLARVEVCLCGAQRATQTDGTRGAWLAPAGEPRKGAFLDLSAHAWRSVTAG